MADGPSAVKKAKTGSCLPECPYGARCYRKNPQHFKEFSHGGVGNSDSLDKKNAGSAPATAASNVSGTTLPPCKYGASCYRKNLLHFAEYSHPTAKAGKDGSGSDTDVIDSDDEKKDQKGTDSNAILSRGLSLVKTFSKMTEGERKELIKKALEEKQRLQKELEGEKKKVADKDKELQHLQSQVNTGQLLMEGEKEAMKSETTTYFTLLPERAYKEGSASQTHFRLAESQFYRLIMGDRGNQIRVTKVEYVVSPKVIRRFRECQAALKKKRGEEFSYPVLGFHGTDEKNIKPIVEAGFMTPKDKNFAMKTDTGWYGAGVYFSEYPSYSMDYIQGAQKLMLCQVLPGKVFKCTKLIHGAELTKGYDSHMSPCGKELVIFDSAAILPAYVVHYTEADAAFSYKGSLVSVECPKAVACAASKVFQGLTITVSGTLHLSQGEMYKLILKHGGKKGTAAKFDILVADFNEWESVSNKVATAQKKKLPVVTESYVYQCISQGKQLDTTDFEHDKDPYGDGDESDSD